MSNYSNCPYCKSDIPNNPVMCPNCGQYLRALFFYMKRMERLTVQVKKLRVAAGEIPEVKKRRQLSFLLITLLYYLYVIPSSLILLSEFSFVEQFHWYLVNLGFAIGAYGIVACQWSDNVSVWMVVLFSVATSEVLYVVIDIFNFSGFPATTDSGEFFALQPKVLPSVVLIAIAASGITLLLNKRVKNDKIFSLKPLTDWALKQEDRARSVINFISTLGAVVAAVFAFIKNFYG